MIHLLNIVMIEIELLKIEVEDAFKRESSSPLTVAVYEIINSFFCIYGHAWKVDLNFEIHLVVINNMFLKYFYHLL